MRALDDLLHKRYTPGAPSPMRESTEACNAIAVDPPSPQTEPRSGNEPSQAPAYVSGGPVIQTDPLEEDPVPVIDSEPSRLLSESPHSPSCNLEETYASPITTSPYTSIELPPFPGIVEAPARTTSPPPQSTAQKPVDDPELSDSQVAEILAESSPQSSMPDDEHIDEGMQGNASDELVHHVSFQARVGNRRVSLAVALRRNPGTNCRRLEIRFGSDLPGMHRAKRTHDRRHRCSSWT